MKTALKHLKLAVSEIEKMPEPCKSEKKEKSKVPKEPKMKKVKDMDMAKGLTEKQKKLPAGLQKAILKSKSIKSKDSPAYNI